MISRVFRTGSKSTNRTKKLEWKAKIRASKSNRRSGQARQNQLFSLNSSHISSIIQTRQSSKGWAQDPGLSQRSITVSKWIRNKNIKHWTLINSTESSTTKTCGTEITCHHCVKSTTLQPKDNNSKETEIYPSSRNWTQTSSQTTSSPKLICYQ